MRISLFKPYIFLIGFVFFLLCIPQKGIDSLRASLISTVIPSWYLMDEENKDITSLQTENHRLKEQVVRIEEWLKEDLRLKKQIEQLCQFSSKSEEDRFYERRGKYLKEKIEHQIQALPAKVVFREPSLWNSSFWVNVGEKDNRLIGRTVVAKNSPVVVGKAIVGVIETVTENKSRVRLITDQLLSPSVRVIRGGSQNQLLFERLTGLIEILKLREDLNSSNEIAQLLSAFRHQLNLDEKDLYLAKGELHGTSSPLWRLEGNKLKGEGFNCDFADEEGPSKNLRTGGNVQGSGGDPLIKIGDLLVTTGMDGIFPPDFHVGVVTKIFPLHEGGCSYSLEAESVIKNLQSLHEVSILPPF